MNERMNLVTCGKTSKFWYTDYRMHVWLVSDRFSEQILKVIPEANASFEKPWTSKCQFSLRQCSL